MLTKAMRFWPVTNEAHGSTSVVAVAVRVRLSSGSGPDWAVLTAEAFSKHSLQKKSGVWPGSSGAGRAPESCTSGPAARNREDAEDCVEATEDTMSTMAANAQKSMSEARGLVWPFCKTITPQRMLGCFLY